MCMCVYPNRKNKLSFFKLAHKHNRKHVNISKSGFAQQESLELRVILVL